MGDSNANLATLIGSRICHDLISPIGAITNGLELLDLAGGVQGPELDLISESVCNAGARIRFFRIAYGASGDQMLGRPEVMSVLSDISHGSRIKVVWVPAEPHPRGEVRLAFLALQCCETAMPYGGTVRIECTDGQWSVTGSADKLIIDEALFAGLTSVTPQQDITPALVQFALLPQVASDLGRTLAVDTDAGSVTLTF